MALMPKRVKHRKVQRGRVRGKARGNDKLSFGDFGLQSLEQGRISAQQLEAARTALTRHMKRRGKLWIKLFPDKPFTKKPLETRMGKGKGNVEGWLAVVKTGNIIFELTGVPEVAAREALARAASKLPVRCRMLSRQTA